MDEQYELLTDWIRAGPFQKDVSSLYKNNYDTALDQYLPMLQQAEKKIPEASFGCEGEDFELFGESLVWKHLRLGETEKKVTFSGFGTFARAMISYACCDITAKEAGEYGFRLRVRGIVTAAVNGKKVCTCGKLGSSAGMGSFTAHLHAGSNRIAVCMFNVHIHCVNSFSLEILNSKTGWHPHRFSPFPGIGRPFCGYCPHFV